MSSYYVSYSPPSSPSLYVDSSSPPSSPAYTLEHNDDDDIPPISLVHPFAASAKSNWHPPSYEKKRPISPATMGALQKKAKHDHIGEPSLQSSPIDDTFPDTRMKELTEEEDIWDRASTRMVDEGHGAVTLDNQNLTHIPEAFIDDLAKFYAPPEGNEIFNSTARLYHGHSNRPLNRVVTVPTMSAERSMQRTHSAAIMSFGLPRDKIQLFLSLNKISFLPLSLLTLQNLRVLSLRMNKIRYIPPEIVGLKGLEDLNISQNLIEHLPAEMLQMSLKSLQVHPNPFQSPTSDDGAWPDLRRRPVSVTNHTMPTRVPLLAELLLRVLLSPSSPAQSSDTILETYYDVPLPEAPASPLDPRTSGKVHFRYSLPTHLRKIFDVCLPGSVYSEDEPAREILLSVDKASAVAGLGLCPSPKHQQLGTPRVFVRQAEERMSWEKVVAGVDVGGSIPLLWRGCQRGCLDFLEPPARETPSAKNVPSFETDSMDVEQEPEDIVQAIQLNMLSSPSFDFDD